MSGESESRALWAVARWIVRHRAAVLCMAFAVVVGLGWPASQIRVGYSVSGFLDSDSPEFAAATEHYDRGLETPDNLLFYAYDASDPLSEEALGLAAELAAALERLDGVEQVLWAGGVPVLTDPVEAARSRTWRRFFVGVDEDGEESGAAGITLLDRALDIDATAALLERMRAAGREFGVDLRLVGLPHHHVHRVVTVRHDQGFFLPLATLMAALVLFWLIPRWTLALQAVLVAPLTVLSTVGVMSLCGVEVTMLTAVLPTLLLAIAVADGVHLVGRFLELRRAGASPEDAAVEAMVRTFFPCLLTTVTTALGFLSLCVAEVPNLVELGLFSAIGLVFAFGYTMAVLPAAMSMVQHVPARQRRFDPVDRTVSWLAVRAGRLRGRVLVVAGAALLAAVPLALQVEKNNLLLADYWDDDPIVVEIAGYEARHVSMVPGEVLVTTEGTFQDDAAWAELQAVVQRLESRDTVARTLSVVDPVADGAPRFLALAAAQRMPTALVDEDGTTARVLVFQDDIGTARFAEYHDEVLRWNDDLQRVSVRAAGAQVVGTAMVDRLVDDLSQSFVSSLGLILLLVAVLFRSLRLGLLAMVPSIIPLVVNLGLMGALGIPLRPITAITFCVAFGLAVDDTVHVLARYREERRRGFDRETALQRCIATAGKPVVVTTLLLLVGFSTILFSGFKAIALFGALVALALAGAVIGALLLLPALLRITDRRGV